ncbi:hypothetical protein BC629DRAFT_906825 [Irpex lacteus]|nr:hypothetical protein BC629DRAFT_906825 [Irpex lacteus]
MRKVLEAFERSTAVSVPTSMRPIDLGSMLYFSRRLWVAVGRQGRVSTRKAWTKTTRTGQEESVDVLPVVAAGHELLAETNGILALGDAVELFELFLGDALNAKRKYISIPRMPTSLGRGGTSKSCALPLRGMVMVGSVAVVVRAGESVTASASVATTVEVVVKKGAPTNNPSLRRSFVALRSFAVTVQLTADAEQKGPPRLPLSKSRSTTSARATFHLPDHINPGPMHG